ncbi:MAG: restriction endonuclease subunit S [Gordonia sp. (in: high G+C Gram-positive bacteria)]|uniref:restriction endonuclease subunit S n=1 Tax=Gordonia sp. (in: high G+C Gram-positive bacteria) TaxID=84139 RepID=UPI0039E2B17C
MKSSSIGDLVDAVNNWNPSNAPDTEFVYIDLSAVDNTAKVIDGAVSHVGRTAPSRARRIVAAGDVLVSTVRPNLNAVAMVPEELDGATASTGFAVLRASDGLDRKYLYHWVRSGQFIADMVRKATGASYPAVTERIVKCSQIPLPPLPEQRRIAAILDHADTLRAKRRQVVAHLNSLTQSIFDLMFGESNRVTTLGDELVFLTSGSRGWAKYYSPIGDNFLRIQNVGRDELILDDMALVSAPDSAEARRTAVQPRDVLLSITADLGRAAVVPNGLGTTFINQHLAILRAPSLNPRYLSAFISSPEGQRRIAGRNREAVKAGLNFDDIRSLEIPYPPRNLQDEFEIRASAVDAFRSDVKRALDTDNQLFASLQARAFRGEL